MTVARPTDPGAWDLALASVRAARHRSEVVVDEVPAPSRLAPHTLALSAEILDEEGEEIASGRFVLLHDPDGQEAWDGAFRVVAFAKARLEPEMAADPMLTEVGWAWLDEALSDHDAEHRNPSGTVTRTASQAFGALAEREWEGTIELRASWTPTTADIGRHVEAWSDLLCTCAGLPPLPVGVVPLPSPRHRR